MKHITGSAIYEILTNVYDNWHEIKMNKSVMKVIDMKTNRMCKNLKIENPSLLDETIQQRVLSFLLAMLSIMIKHPTPEQTLSNVDIMI